LLGNKCAELKTFAEIAIDYSLVVGNAVIDLLNGQFAKMADERS